MTFILILPGKKNYAFAAQADIDNKILQDKVFRLSAPEEVSTFPATVNVITQLYQNIGYQVEIIKMPAKRAMHEAIHGQWLDGVVGRTALSEKLLKDYIRIPVALGSVSIHAYFLSGTLTQPEGIGSWADLRDYKVASLRGFILSTNNLSKHGVDFQQVTHSRQAFDMLLRRRVDLVVLPEKIAKQALKSDEFSQIKSSPNIVDKIKVYHFIHQKHQALVPVLTQNLSQLLSSDNRLH